jgi:hypothetical protein
VGCEVERAMDVELQILKHLKRDARPTVSVIDQYCCAYNDLFYDVRSYECLVVLKVLGLPKYFFSTPILSYFKIYYNWNWVK